MSLRGATTRDPAHFNKMSLSRKVARSGYVLKYVKVSFRVMSR